MAEAGNVHGNDLRADHRASLAGSKKVHSLHKHFSTCAVFALLYPTTRSTVGASPAMAQLATDEGRKFFAYAGKRVTARVDAIMEKAWARLCTSWIA